MKKTTTVDTYLIKNYSIVVRKNPRSLLFFPLADAYKRRGMPEIAIEICLKGIKYYPYYMSARALLGELFFVCDRHDDAEKELKRVARNVPDNLAARKILVEIYLKKGMMEKVEKISAELISLCGYSKAYESLKRDIIERLSASYPKGGRTGGGKSGNELNEQENASLESLMDRIFANEISAIKTRAREDDIIEDWGAFEEIEQLFEERGTTEIPINKKGQLKMFEHMLNNIKKE